MKALTLAPATPIFLPTRMTPLLTALAIGGSIFALRRYHPSVTSSSGYVVPGRLSDSIQKIFETHKASGNAAGASCVDIKRNAGRLA